MACARVSSESSPPVAIIAFDGMQSHRWAAPPTTSRSTSVTSAPSVAATVAHVLPAGPPPRMTSRVLGTCTAYRRRLTLLRHRVACGTLAARSRPMSELRQDSSPGGSCWSRRAVEHDPSPSRSRHATHRERECHGPTARSARATSTRRRPSWSARAGAPGSPGLARPGVPEPVPDRRRRRGRRPARPGRTRSWCCLPTTTRLRASSTTTRRSRSSPCSGTGPAAHRRAGHAHVQVLINQGRAAGGVDRASARPGRGARLRAARRHRRRRPLRRGRRPTRSSVIGPTRSSASSRWSRVARRAAWCPSGSAYAVRDTHRRRRCRPATRGQHRRPRPRRCARAP